MAVDAVFGTEPAWFAEVDEAPARVLAYRHPTVPNLGDVTRVNWEEAPRVDVLAGGFPCQDVSLAGARRGLKDGTRSGLWSEFAKAIDVLRPDWVVIENVRGLLSAEAHSDVEPCPWCLGDDPGEPALRALGAVLGDLADLGFDAEWTGIRASDLGACHHRFRIFVVAWRRDLADTESFGWSDVATQDDGPAAGEGRAFGDADRLRPAVVFDTPDTMPDAPSAVVQLLPTPTLPHPAADSRDPAARMASRHQTELSDVVRLLPTPRATRGGSSTEMSYAMGGARSDDERPQGVVVPGADWGPYAAAVSRWERVLGRPAPSPVRMDGKGGKARLNPELPEWMMGWPAGWVTAPEIGLTRAQQLKAAGNGVVPQQAAAALVEMLARPGVPAVLRGAA